MGRRDRDDGRSCAGVEEEEVVIVSTPREPAHRRADYRHFQRIATRWMDNDTYGHVNNVVYYSWFDTVVNEYLIRSGVLDVESSPVIGFVVETQCRYFSTLAFPQPVEAGLRVSTIGNSSVRYELAVFADGADTASAQGHFIHVYVDRATQRPTALPAPLRAALERIRE
jgi:acyl-CoA thioester hydrolase